MQRRLLVSTLAVAVAAVLLLGVPLGFVVGGLKSRDANAQLKHDASALATGLQERFDEGLPPDISGFARLWPDRYVTIVERGGGRSTAGTRPPAHDTITGSARTRDFTVIVAADDSIVIGQVTSGLVMIGSLAL
ncbi:MAG TPA: hypothetical protein VGR98_01320, partial [Streptosporangiaceae bacterium]|nr:hypothetical protein [Streptosporangiaceae bacterium]